MHLPLRRVPGGGGGGAELRSPADPAALLALPQSVRPRPKLRSRCSPRSNDSADGVAAAAAKVSRRRQTARRPSSTPRGARVVAHTSAARLLFGSLAAPSPIAALSLRSDALQRNNQMRARWPASRQVD